MLLAPHDTVVHASRARTTSDCPAVTVNPSGRRPMALGHIRTNEALRMKRGTVGYQLKRLAANTRCTVPQELERLPAEYINIYS